MDHLNKRPKFKYQPLHANRKEIRVLVFESSCYTWLWESNLALRCTMKHLSLLEEPYPQYYAVSYCWGKNPPLQRIIINDQEFQVPASAIEALKCVCHPVHGKRDLPLWIDAICINQADNAEKSRQVAMMADVFTDAMEVLCYIGGEDETSESGLEAMKKILDALSRDVEVGDDFFDDESGWANTIGFFDSPYFRRLWVVQEIVLSTSATIWRGRLSLPWSDMKRIGEVLDPTRDYSGTPGNDGYLCARVISDSDNHGESQLDSLLYRYSLFETTDPRDMIYATLGLFDQSMDSIDSMSIDLLKPDYSLPVGEVFRRAAIAVLRSCSRQTRSLALAQSSSPADRYADPENRIGDVYDMPSWVPQYDRQSGGGGSWIYRTNRGADARMALSLDFIPDMSDVRKSQGIRVDAIELVGACLPYLDPDQRNACDCVRHLGSAMELSWQLNDDSQSDQLESIIQKASTYTIYNPDKKRTDGERLQLAADFGAFMLMCKEHCKFTENTAFEEALIDAGAHKGDADEFVTTLCYQLSGRHFAKTSTGQYAMVPQYTKPGDVLCIIFGSSVPLVLRPKGNEYQGHTGEFWQLIGTAYVYGIMAGEHIDKLRDEGRLEEETRWFSLI